MSSMNNDSWEYMTRGGGGVPLVWMKQKLNKSRGSNHKRHTSALSVAAAFSHLPF